MLEPSHARAHDGRDSPGIAAPVSNLVVLVEEAPLKHQPFAHQSDSSNGVRRHRAQGAVAAEGIGSRRRRMGPRVVHWCRHMGLGLTDARRVSSSHCRTMPRGRSRWRSGSLVLGRQALRRRRSPPPSSRSDRWARTETPRARSTTERPPRASSSLRDGRSGQSTRTVLGRAVLESDALSRSCPCHP